MKREAAVRAMWPQAKAHWPGAPRAGRIEEYIVLLSLQREQCVCQHLGPQNFETINFCCLWFVVICYDSPMTQIPSPNHFQMKYYSSAGWESAAVAKPKPLGL